MSELDEFLSWVTTRHLDAEVAISRSASFALIALILAGIFAATMEGVKEVILRFFGRDAGSIAPIVGPKRYNRAKLDAYECGIEPSPQPVVGGGRMPVAYYLTAMLFILFDIEMVFLYPFAVSANALGVFGLVEIVLFIVTVGFAYIYVWRRGGLDWN